MKNNIPTIIRILPCYSIWNFAIFLHTIYDSFTFGCIIFIFIEVSENAPAKYSLQMFFDLHLEIDIKGGLRTKLYDKR